jgi:hypothetical protein
VVGKRALTNRSGWECFDRDPNGVTNECEHWREMKRWDRRTVWIRLLHDDLDRLGLVSACVTPPWFIFRIDPRHDDDQCAVVQNVIMTENWRMRKKTNCCPSEIGGYQLLKACHSSRKIGHGSEDEA